MTAARDTAGLLDFTGKTCLVIGGSSGIGNGIAHDFRRHGAAVTVTGTRPGPGDYDTAQGSDLTDRAYAQLDVTAAGAIEQLAATIPALDILVLCQGTALYKRQEFTREGWEQVRAVNLDSVMHGALAFKPHLTSSHGALIIISSVAAYIAMLGNPAYAASKAGAAHLTASLGQSWAAEGIRVNGIAPGHVRTKLTSVTFDHPQRSAAALASVPLGRIGTPEDIGHVALFLASPMAAYVIVQTIIVDGGLTLA
jgi:3-oxoacyl-[acyl-carrier protein] reductase